MCDIGGVIGVNGGPVRGDEGGVVVEHDRSISLLSLLFFFFFCFVVVVVDFVVVKKATELHDSPDAREKHLTYRSI